MNSGNHGRKTVTPLWSVRRGGPKVPPGVQFEHKHHDYTDKNNNKTQIGYNTDSQSDEGHRGAADRSWQ